MHASVLLLFTLLSAGSETSRACGEAEHEHGASRHSHLCYECNGLGNYCLKKPAVCPSGFSKCMSSTIVLGSGGTIKKKECVDDCQNGSMNFGLTKTSFSCCGTNFCNAEDPPDPRLTAPNGRQCYYCDGQSCSNTVSCSGTEDGCITATVTNRGTAALLKGCITKSVCGLLKCSFIQDVSCCEGNLCNGGKGLTPGVMYNAEKRLNLSAIQSFTYNSVKSVTQRIPYQGAKNIDTYRSLYDDAKKIDYRSVYEASKNIDTYRSLYDDTKKIDYSSLYEASKKVDAYRSVYEASKKIDYSSLYEASKKVDAYLAMIKDAKKSATRRSPYNGAKSVTHSFLFSALLLPAALILQ